MKIFYRKTQVDQLQKVLSLDSPALPATPFTYIYGIKHTGKTCTLRSTLSSSPGKYYYVDASVHAAYSLRLFLEYVLDLFGGVEQDVEEDYSPSRKCGTMLEFTIALAEICADGEPRYLVFTPSLFYRLDHR
jgi:hypothetical protein